MKILLVEDEPKLLYSISKGLREHMLQVDTATNGLEAGALAADGEYAVIVSDVMMPDQTGLEFLRALRAKGNYTPVILLTAMSQTDDKIEGFEAGADDYLTKPFEFRELLMRIRALARRPVMSYKEAGLLRWKNIEMNVETRELQREGKKIQLTPREAALMEYLMRNPERIISKTEIMEKVWNLNFDTGTNVIEVYVNFLRRKVEKGFERKIIHTQFKNGYILQEEMSAPLA
jgi:two-component system copper resistance phosphate regulon response regulator CusR